MCAQYGGPAPAFPSLLRRHALLDRLSNKLASSTLLVAPSGYGKTVLAAQLAASFDIARWVDCRGEEPDSAMLRDEVAHLLGLDLAGSSTRRCDADLSPLAGYPGNVDHLSRCLVLDDVRVDNVAQVTDDLWAAAQILSQNAGTLVVTSTEVGLDAARALRHFEMIGPDELRFTESEALAIATMRGISDEAALCVWGETGGHAAFFAVMLQAMGETRALPKPYNPRLSAWIEHVVARQVGDADLLVLEACCILGRGRAADLRGCGVPANDEELTRLGEAMPLLRIDVERKGAAAGHCFFAHELLSEYFERALRRTHAIEDRLVQRLIRVLTARGDLLRAARFVDVTSNDAVVGFLLDHGFECVRRGASRRLVELLEAAPLATVVSEPRLLLLWADALADCDEFEESLAKARAARVLADHERDPGTACEAVAVALDALRLMNRWDEAEVLLKEGLSLSEREAVPPEARAAVWRAGAPMLVLAGDYEGAERLLRETLAVGPQDPRSKSELREASETLALLPLVARGDMLSTVKMLSPWAALDEGRLVQRVDSRGNLAVALVELGRIPRASSLLREILPVACTSSLACFLPVLGCTQFALGEEGAGLDAVAHGIRLALEAGSESEVAENRVFEAMLLRAAGRPEDSLTSAERSYERLCVQDHMDFRRLAALEVAASLLALGDASAARAWAEPVASSGFGTNAHHAFRGAMVLALCDHHSGETSAGIARLSLHADHIRSENSNFQAAIYSRAFPDLLAMMAAAVGAADLPVHMLRMIPPENAEQTLRSSRGYLKSSEWALLGERLLGKEQFDAFVERKGRPICRVRMFGGLEVKVGDRPVRERDWKKRKARTVFAIMVLNRGQEVSRDQLLDHVWPDLPEDRAKNNFYVAWSSMKGALMGADAKVGPCPYIDGTAGRCRIVRDAVRSDIDEFEELIAEGREGDAAGDPDRVTSAFERLSALYRGELLPGDLYEDWFAPLRDRYKFDFIGAMLRLVDIYLERDDPCNALVYARRALGVDPSREDLYQATLRCQIAAGQRSAAVETFVQCKTQLAEELGLDPSAETLALYQQILVMEDRPRYDDYGVTG